MLNGLFWHAFANNDQKIKTWDIERSSNCCTSNLNPPFTLPATCCDDEENARPEIRQMKRAKKLPGYAPRNPLVVAAKFRKAGGHGKSKKALRREEKMKIKKLVSSTGIEPVIDP